VKNRVAVRRFTIDELAPGPAPFAGKKVVVTAPGRNTAGVKAVVTIRIRADQLGQNDTPGEYVVLNVGVSIPRCTTLSPPTPSLCKRGVILQNGDLQFTIYTSAVVDDPAVSGTTKRCCAIRLKRCCATQERGWAPHRERWTRAEL